MPFLVLKNLFSLSWSTSFIVTILLDEKMQGVEKVSKPFGSHADGNGYGNRNRNKNKNVKYHRKICIV